MYAGLHHRESVQLVSFQNLLISPFKPTCPAACLIGIGDTVYQFVERKNVRSHIRSCQECLLCSFPFYCMLLLVTEDSMSLGVITQSFYAVFTGCQVSNNGLLRLEVFYHFLLIPRRTVKPQSAKIKVFPTFLDVQCT